MVTSEELARAVPTAEQYLQRIHLKCTTRDVETERFVKVSRQRSEEPREEV